MSPERAVRVEREDSGLGQRVDTTLVQGILAGMTEWRVAKVMDQCHSFGQILVEP